MRCPYCQTENRDDREKCYHCEKDVSMLRVIVNKARHHYNVALEHAERGRIHEAVNEMRNCIDLDHQFAPAHVVLGTLYAKRGEFDKARECWNTALALNPDMAKSRDYLQRAEQVQAALPLLRTFQILILVLLALVVVLIGALVYLERPDAAAERVRDAQRAQAQGQFGRAIDILSDVVREGRGSEATLANASMLRDTLASELRQQVRMIQEMKFRQEYPEALKAIRDLRSRQPDEPTSAAMAVILDDIQFYYRNQIEDLYQGYLAGSVSYLDIIARLDEFLRSTPELPDRNHFSRYIARVRDHEAVRQITELQIRFEETHDVREAIADMMRISAEFPGAESVPQKRIDVVDAVLSWMFDHFQEMIDARNFAAARAHLVEISLLAREFSDIVDVQGPVDAAMSVLDDLERAGRLQLAEDAVTSGTPETAREILLQLAVDDTLTTAEMLVVDGLMRRLEERLSPKLRDDLKALEKAHLDLSLSDTRASETLAKYPQWLERLDAMGAPDTDQARAVALALAAAVKLRRADEATTLSRRLDGMPAGGEFRKKADELLERLKKDDGDRSAGERTRTPIVESSRPEPTPTPTTTRRRR